MTKEFNGENICTFCNHFFKGYTYYLNKNEGFFGKVRTNVKLTEKLRNETYWIILNCPKCGHGDEIIKK